MCSYGLVCDMTGYDSYAKRHQRRQSMTNTTCGPLVLASATFLVSLNTSSSLTGPKRAPSLLHHIPIVGLLHLPSPTCYFTSDTSATPALLPPLPTAASAPFAPLHPLHPRIQHARLLPPILPSLLRGIPHHDARAVILRAEVFSEMHYRLCCAGRVDGVPGEVDYFLVCHERGEAVG
jgi:hypothetical protein